MGMGVLMKLDAFGLKDLQTTNALLNLFEAEGINDIRFVREQIERHISNSRLEARVEYTQFKSGQRKQPVCPQCGSNRWRPNKDTNGEMYVLCKDCQYSELLGDK